MDLDLSLSFFLFTINLKKKFGQKSVVQTKFWSKIIWAPKNLGPKRLVKIGSVTTEIFLIWRNVDRRNGAWKNVTGPRNLP